MNEDETHGAPYILVDRRQDGSQRVLAPYVEPAAAIACRDALRRAGDLTADVIVVDADLIAA